MTALICALVFVVVARRSKDKISKGAMAVWAMCMFFAAAQGPLLAFTDLDAQLLPIARIITPVGWLALSICAARRLVVG